MKPAFKIPIFAAFSSIGFGAISFLLSSPFVEFFLWPGMHFGSVATKVIPSQVIYAIVPEGGGPAFLLIVLITSILLWTCMFVGAYRIYRMISHQ
jgi:hypothetical protein